MRKNEKGNRRNSKLRTKIRNFKTQNSKSPLHLAKSVRNDKVTVDIPKSKSTKLFFQSRTEIQHSPERKDTNLSEKYVKG